MKPQDQDNKDLNNIVREEPAVYETREALEDARLREAINRTAAEKFRFLMTLMKMNNQMRKAKIHYK